MESRPSPQPERLMISAASMFWEVPTVGASVISNAMVPYSKIATASYTSQIPRNDVCNYVSLCNIGLHKA